MAPDISRSTFNPAKRFNGVRSQQGRVALDADWNEQVDIARNRVETETVDVVGLNGTPKGDPGFGITVNGGVLTISAGRTYVGGVLCTNDFDGLALDAQPDFPGFSLANLAAGVYIAYLDVWEREITGLQDADLLEPALGGPDTCTRTRTTWQVNLLNVGAVGADVGCADTVPGWPPVASSSATLAAQVTPDATSTGPCVVAPTAGYTSLENHLYRVEMYDASVPSFVWSRENGSVATAWLGQNVNDLAVAGLGRDGTLGFSNGDWIELTDDAHVLNGAPGTLVRILATAGTTITVDPSTVQNGPIVFPGAALNPIVRRWDSAGAQTIAAGTWVDLEDGVQVQFAAPFGACRNGDYWLIPARTGIGVLWPVGETNAPLFQPSAAVAHSYCRLAILSYDGKQTWTILRDCRSFFTTLSELNSAVVNSVHVTAVTLVNGQTPLPNDSPISPDQLASGILVTCDQPVDPASVGTATCEVTLSVPFPLDTSAWPPTQPSASAIFATQPVTLNATVTTVLQQPSNLIAWTPTTSWSPTDLSKVIGTYGTPSASGMLAIPARLRLRGRFIWAAGNPNVRLDGTSFGAPRDGGGTDIVLPSGSGGGGDDFEMWFWLTQPPTPTVSFALAAPSVVIGETVEATVSLSEAAPTGGTVIALTTTSALTAAMFGAQNIGGIAQVPQSVTVPAGSTQATFQIPTTGYIASTVLVTISAPAYASGAGAAPSVSFLVQPRTFILHPPPPILIGRPVTQPVPIELPVDVVPQPRPVPPPVFRPPIRIAPQVGEKVPEGPAEGARPADEPKKPKAKPKRKPRPRKRP